MYAWGQPLLTGDAHEQIPESGPLLACQSGADIVFVRHGDVRDLMQLAARGWIQRVQAAIVGVAAALNEAVPLEVVDKRDDAAGMHPHSLRDHLLAESRRRRDHAHEPDMRRRQANRRESFAYAFGRVRAELSEQKRNPQVLVDALR
jgi:hypothetical protein